TWRFATTSIVTATVTLGSLGCGDSPVAPLTPVARRTPSFAPFDSAMATSVGIAPGTRTRTDSIIAPNHDPIGTLTIDPNRHERSQSLGFRNDVPSVDCLESGTATGVWRLRFSGYGCVAITTDANGTALNMPPAVAFGAMETHAPLLLGPEFGDKLTLNARLQTVQQ